jgi:hypothetical protein
MAFLLFYAFIFILTTVCNQFSRVFAYSKFLNYNPRLDPINSISYQLGNPTNNKQSSLATKSFCLVVTLEICILNIPDNNVKCELELKITNSS